MLLQTIYSNGTIHFFKYFKICANSVHSRSYKLQIVWIKTSSQEWNTDVTCRGPVLAMSSMVKIDVKNIKFVLPFICFLLFIQQHWFLKISHLSFLPSSYFHRNAYYLLCYHISLSLLKSSCPVALHTLYGLLVNSTLSLTYFVNHRLHFFSMEYHYLIGINCCQVSMCTKFYVVTISKYTFNHKIPYYSFLIGHA